MEKNKKENNQNKKIAFVAPQQYAKSLSLLGFKTFEADSEQKAEQTIEDLKTKDFRLIFVSGDIFSKEIPGVVVLPGMTKKPETDFLQQIIKKAIGKEIKLS